MICKTQLRRIQTEPYLEEGNGNLLTKMNMTSWRNPSSISKLYLSNVYDDMPFRDEFPIQICAVETLCLNLHGTYYHHLLEACDSNLRPHENVINRAQKLGVRWVNFQVIVVKFSQGDI